MHSSIKDIQNEGAWECHGQLHLWRAHHKKRKTRGVVDTGERKIRREAPRPFLCSDGVGITLKGLRKSLQFQ